MQSIPSFLTCYGRSDMNACIPHLATGVKNTETTTLPSPRLVTLESQKFEIPEDPSQTLPGRSSMRPIL